MTHAKVILVVEDNPDHAQTISDLISMATPHRVLMADSQGARKFVQLYKPDLLVMDYLLGDTTGIMLYDYIHANHELAHIPAIIVSAALERCKSDIESRHLHGLSKPFEADELLSLINTLLS